LNKSRTSLQTNHKFTNTNERVEVQISVMTYNLTISIFVISWIKIYELLSVQIWTHYLDTLHLSKSLWKVNCGYYILCWWGENKLDVFIFSSFNNLNFPISYFIVFLFWLIYWKDSCLSIIAMAVFTSQ
jgi:hypothetical protein